MVKKTVTGTSVEQTPSLKLESNHILNYQQNSLCQRYLNEVPQVSEAELKPDIQEECAEKHRRVVNGLQRGGKRKEEIQSRGGSGCVGE